MHLSFNIISAQLLNYTVPKMYLLRKDPGGADLLIFICAKLDSGNAKDIEEFLRNFTNIPQNNVIFMQFIGIVDEQGKIERYAGTTILIPITRFSCEQFGEKSVYDFFHFSKRENHREPQILAPNSN